jgi:acylphosphatase
VVGDETTAGEDRPVNQPQSYVGGDRAIRRRIVVTGRVQGVFFRDTCRRVAQRLGVRGWVRNRADGAVEAVFEGEPAAVEALIDWARSGPEYAYVTGLRIAEEIPQGLVGFEIR